MGFPTTLIMVVTMYLRNTDWWQ